MERSTELQGVIQGWFESVAKGDGAWLEAHVARDANLRIIGTDPQEWLKGGQAGDLLLADLALLGGKVRIQVNEVEAFSEGSVGWGAALPSITLEDGRTVAPRWSAVFRKVDGTWKLAQVHASVGVPNEQLFGMEFPQEVAAS